MSIPSIPPQLSVLGPMATAQAGESAEIIQDPLLKIVEETEEERYDEEGQ